jgi:pyruvate dehydrogenase E2 component (dihydrolipoamide acetyltransferase)
MSELIKVPDIGGEGEVIEILVKEGDRVEAEQSLVVLESDKASMEVPSPKAGVVKAIKVNLGDTLKQGSELIELEAEDAGGEAEQADASAGGSDPNPVEEAEQDQAATEGEAEADEGRQQGGSTDGQTSTREVRIPDIGDGKARIIEILVKAGDAVEKDQSLVTLESDKASMEIPAPFAGTVESVEAKLEQDVATGDLLLHMKVAAAGGRDKPAGEAKAPAAKSQASPAKPSEPAKDAQTTKSAERAEDRPAPPPVGGPSREGRKVHAGPAVRQLAREFGVDLAEVTPTGPKDRILKEDVQKFVQTTLKQSKSGTAGAVSGAGIPPVPEVDFSRFGEVEVKDMTRLQQVGAVNLHRSWLNVPHVTQFDQADISELEAFRKDQKAAADKAGVKLTVLPFLLKACAHLLREQPHFNVSLVGNGKQLVHKHYIHIGFAVDTPEGLLVPVIRNVDQKSLLQLAAEAAELADKARNKKLGADAMQGACFTISSLGHIGGTYFTPIVNAPEVAILGVSRATMQPVWDGTAFQPRLMLPLSLSYDHRAINGAAAAQFTRRLGELLGDIRTLLL